MPALMLVSIIAGCRFLLGAMLQWCKWQCTLETEAVCCGSTGRSTDQSWAALVNQIAALHLRVSLYCNSKALSIVCSIIYLRVQCHFRRQKEEVILLGNYKPLLTGVHWKMLVSFGAYLKCKTSVCYIACISLSKCSPLNVDPDKDLRSYM